MIITFKVQGPVPPPRKNSKDKRSIHMRMKSFARGISLYRMKKESTKRVGPMCRFALPLRGRRRRVILTSKLNKSECAFGVLRPSDLLGGGFTGLTDWEWFEGPDEESSSGFVSLDMARAEEIGAHVWLESFIRKVLERCGYRIVAVNRQESANQKQGALSN
jgi:hypothetical protein